MAGAAARLAFLAAVLAGTAATAAPQRIVSINLCADELVLQLADRAQVASVSFLSRDPAGSNVAALAATVPVNHGQAEEIIASRPDLVLAGRYTTRGTVALLKQVGLSVVELDAPATFDEVTAQIRAVAALLGHAERGEAMVAAMMAGLAAVTPVERPLRALVLRPNGFTVGQGSLVDHLMRRAGLVNLGADPVLATYRELPLEALVLAKPDLVILDEEEVPAPALAYDVLRHPVLRNMPNRMQAAGLPSRLWTCAGPAVVEAVARLAEIGRRLEGTP
ncbi:ABC transporter substrate-binding protein [Zavarzinia compransoris]|uniref:ABC transporter substrate-binding protein n=1 Tax=Zavarzinia compransoris TaxID=1264899 RepID=A0A317E0H2_9PROT|nr:ABC transporter substrate-binding protein [Zavarzinia compransoris]PWR19626.1 ABC transporter substrate-binding protein [Zavarzinia compransoris]TDP40388.1 iron complex transport system substrate-binding protein [Zavarzinia compransoris]